MVDRTKAYNAIYTSSDKKTHKLNVRIFKRLAKYGLALSLKSSASGFRLVESLKQEDGKNISLEEISLSEDLVLIDKIIRESTSLINSLEDEDINVSLDNDIATLESYFYDYLFQSTIARIARKERDAGVNTQLFYKKILYGTSSNINAIDPNSLFGTYTMKYLDYHKINEHVLEEKKAYIQFLTDLSNKALELLNANKKDSIIPYSKYLNYLKKRSIEDEESETIEKYV